MKFIWDSAFGLLLTTGSLLGLVLPFGKLAAVAGISPLVWAFVVSGGAGTMLLMSLLLRGERISLSTHKLRYFFVAAVISYAIPNLLLFSAIPHLGAGYTGLMFTLSPVLTLLFSMILRVRKPTPLGIAGIAVGFIGALMVAWTRGEAGHPADLVWVIVGLCIPLALAAGNIYRTIDWPGGAGPIELAVGSHLASASILLTIMLATGGADFTSLGAIPLVVSAQVVASSLMFVFFFRLQSVGGPVYLSQIGYVAAAVGLIAGKLFLGESYGLLTWFGALVISIGIAMTTTAQLSR